MKKIILLLLCALFILGACNTQAPATEETQLQTTPTDMQQSKDSLKTLFENMRDSQYRVKYDVRTTAGGQEMRSTMEQYFKDESNMRMDFEVDGQVSRSYLDEDSFTTCSQEDGTWKCFEMEQPADAAENFQSVVEDELDNFDVVELETKSIAGETARCFSISSVGESAEYCFTTTGIPLLVKISGQGFVSEMRAVEFDDAVVDADLELPIGSETVTMDDFMGQIEG